MEKMQMAAAEKKKNRTGTTKVQHKYAATTAAKDFLLPNALGLFHQ
jgi:hypothetical protein